LRTGLSFMFKPPMFKPLVRVAGRERGRPHALNTSAPQRSFAKSAGRFSENAANASRASGERS
jgi:hypothetical protein